MGDLSLDGLASASPFPSPSSSFLTPPTPGAHEFALKPLSPRKGCTTPPRLIHRPLSTASTSSRNSPSFFDPALFSSRPAPPSPAGGSTPSLSRNSSTRSRANSLRNHRVSSHASSSPGPTLAPRVEGAATPHNHRVSPGSTRSFSLASPSKQTFDMGISASSPAIQEAASITTISSEDSSISPSTTSTSIDTQLQPSQPDQSKVFIKIRDFAFQPPDERHNGQGPLVPKPNRVGRMNRRLGGRSSSISSSDGDGIDEDDEDDESDTWGWNAYGTRGFGYGGGWVGGKFSWALSSGSGAATAATIFDQEKAYAAAAANLSAAASKPNGIIPSQEDGYPSRSEMDRNFLDSESEEFYDAEGDEERDTSFGVQDDDEPLYPGLYRALYAFEPEGTAEMRLVEDQIVRVVGRGGGVGWAVVVADGGTEIIEDKTAKHALVPESYLEPYNLDWELDESDVATNRRTA